MFIKTLNNFLIKSPWHNMDENKNVFFKTTKSSFKLPKNFNFNLDFNLKILIILVFSLIFIWLTSGIYKIDEGEEAIVTRFGKYVRKAYPGLNYHLPEPIESVIIEKVNRSRRIEIGYRSNRSLRPNYSSGFINDKVSKYQTSNVDNNKYITAESTMLTGDENIIDLTADVMWHIKDLSAFVFNVHSPEETVKIVAESAIREIIGETPIISVLSSQKQEIANRIERLSQEILDQYAIGIEIEKVQLLKAEPPAEVIDAYRDVQTSRADRENEINMAQAYKNDILPQARGEAAKVFEEAKGYKQEVISNALGESKRFEAILAEYKLNKQITKDRLYLSTIELILKDSNKVVIGEGSNLLPHMAIKPNKQ